MLVYDVELYIVYKAQLISACRREELIMGDEWEQNPSSGQPNQDDLDKRIEEIRRKVIEGTSEAQMRIKRVVDKAGAYWQQTNTPVNPAMLRVSKKSAFAILLICGVLGTGKLRVI